MAASITALLLSSSVAFAQAAPPAASPALQFVIADRALKTHASVANNELTNHGWRERALSVVRDRHRL
jgi:hypothetical protein